MKGNEPLDRQQWRMGRSMAVAILAVAIFANAANAGWLEGLWFEASGTYGPIDPTVSAALKNLGVDLPVTGIDFTGGVAGSIHQDVIDGLSVFARGGYERGSVDVPPPQNFIPGGGSAQTEDQVSVVPIDIGVDYRLPFRHFSMVFDVSGGARVVDHKQTFDSGKSFKDSETVWGVRGSLGIEVGFWSNVLAGVRFGFRASETADFPGFSMSDEGYLAGVYVGVKPWAPSN